MKRLLLSCLVSFSVLSCATPAPEKKTGWDEVQKSETVAATTHAKFDPREFASRRLRPKVCLPEARRLADINPDDGWTALKICIKDVNFSLLTELMEEPFLNEIQTRPDGAQVIARVIANRGANPDKDLAIINRFKAPVFAFGAAMAAPKTYKGQLVLIRAKVAEIRNEGKRSTVMLDEYTIGSYSYDKAVGAKHKYSSSSSGSGRLDYAGSGKSSGSGGSSSGSYSGKVSGSYNSNRDSSSQTVEERFDNSSSETGVQALGNLQKPDPYLTVDHEYLILARFEGTKASSEEGESPLGLLSVVSYFEPGAAIF